MNLRWKIAQAAEIRWWQNYLKKKTPSEYLAWKKDYWVKMLAKLAIDYPKNSRMLDAGCGPAGIFMALEGHQVEALDPLLDSYEKTLEHFSREMYPNVHFYSQALEEFEVKQPYDVVFCLNAINHVSDLEMCFDNIIAATKKGGTLVVSIDAHNHGFFKYLFRTLPGDILHPHQYNLEEYLKMLTDRACTIQSSTLFDKGFFFDYYVVVVQRSRD